MSTTAERKPTKIGKAERGIEWMGSDVDVYERTVDRIPDADLPEDGMRQKTIKICCACSHGGHLTEMLSLQEAFEGHDTFYFCYDADTTRKLPNVYTVPNMARNPVEFVKNLFRVTKIFLKEKPDLVVSTGAEIAIPVILVAKLMRIATLYIECGAQVTKASFTGRIMYRLADDFYVQWPELISTYGPRAMFRGSLIDSSAPVDKDRSHERRMKVTMVQPAQVGAFSSDQPPMGLAYIGSILEQHGCEVRVVDANVEKLPTLDVSKIIIQQRPDLVCFTVTTPLLPSALDIVRVLRKLENPPILVAGGPHATVLPAEMLEEGMFDYVVRSEGEDTTEELIERILAGQDAEGVAGVSWRRNGEIVHNTERPLTKRIEHFPYPDWTLYPLKRYSSIVRRENFSLPITTSRGCPFGCTFCYKGVYGRRLRMRTPEAVVDEWEFLVKRYGAREIAVLDDVFTFDAERAIAICDLLVERGLNHIPWSTTNGIRADNATLELFQALKRGGCYRVYFGIESGVQKVMDSLQKKIKVEQVRNAVAWAKEAGLEVGGYFMIGNVGETYEDMDGTVEFAMELDPDYAQFTIATPYPGTGMYQQVVSGGEMLISSWEQLASYGTSVFKMDHLNPDDVGRKYREAFRKFYFRPRVVLRQLRYLMTWNGLKNSFYAGVLLLKLAILGGRRRVTVSGMFR